jgi:hypothetical protein
VKKLFLSKLSKSFCSIWSGYHTIVNFGSICNFFLVNLITTALQLYSSAIIYGWRVRVYCNSKAAGEVKVKTEVKIEVKTGACNQSYKIAQFI